MKTKFSLLAALLASAVASIAAPLPGTTAVHTKPDISSPAVTYLKAGTEPVVAQDALATTPAGWLAVELPGPFEGYVLSKDIQKSLDVRVGASIRLLPKPESGELATMAAADKAEITGLHGKWTQIRLEKKITGYINIGNAPGYLPPIATTPAPSTKAPAPMAAAPVAPTVYGTTAAGKPAPVSLADSGSISLPRLFQGKFVSTRSPFHPRRPYDWAVVDDAGSRYAYLDITKLLLTEQIESYVNHQVVVYGAAKAVSGGKDIVIEVESLQLK
jgi:hypothetical protein